MLPPDWSRAATKPLPLWIRAHLGFVHRFSRRGATSGSPALVSLFPARPATDDERRIMKTNTVLQIIFAFFLGLVVVAFVGIGVNTFYPNRSGAGEPRTPSGS